MLRAGGTAVDAVELAIKTLEDREITNAGYGSNLTIDGLVECDATIVDHYGRSGACGAVPCKYLSTSAEPLKRSAIELKMKADHRPGVKNPISLARVILNESTRPLSLARVPPNLLVGQGATDYAFEKGLPVLPPDYLVSAAARERFVRWRKDLNDAEASRTTLEIQQSDYPDKEFERDPFEESPRTLVRSNTNPLLKAPHLPVPQPTAPTADLMMGQISSKEYQSQTSSSPPWTSCGGQDFNFNKSPGLATPASSADLEIPRNKMKRLRTSDGFDETNSSESTARPSASNCASRATQPANKTTVSHAHETRDDDHITDTVGAIAIDCFGQIAAGSSSGGIGMKHRGRMGPAALVGIGTAVIPVNSHDVTATSVAAVTSGTGEHMATTMAARDSCRKNLRQYEAEQERSTAIHKRRRRHASNYRTRVHAASGRD